MEWSTACPDWQERIVARRSLIPFDPLYPDEAAAALAVFKSLRVVDLPGQPTFGECCDQFVFDFVAAIFGAYDAETGRQLIREFFMLISKKNTKSTVAAGIMLTALIRNWRHDEELLILAPTIEVAQNSFKPAAGMVRADEELLDIFHVQDHVRTITHRTMRAALKVVAADTDAVSGKKSGRILVDELWVFGKRPNADAMLMEATGGQISREEGWVIYLSTQSDEPPAGVFKQKLDYYRDVRDGKIEDRKSLGVLYEFPQAMLDSKAYLDPANFYITNPNIGRSVSAEWLADNLRKVRDAKDGAFQKFLAKHLNIEIGLNLRSDRWTGADFWEPAARPGLTLQAVIERSDLLEVGIDGGGLDDMLGLCVLGRDAASGNWLAWCKAWVHPIALERRKSEAPRYRDFERDGDLSIVEGIGDDVEEIRDIAELLVASGKLDKAGVDPVGIGAVTEALQEAGVPEESIVGISQGWKLAGAIKTVERKLAEGALLHGGTRLMAWCVGNCRIEPRGNAVLITKQASGTAKIDPVMGLLNAAALMTVAPQSTTHQQGLVLLA